MHKSLCRWSWILLVHLAASQITQVPGSHRVRHHRSHHDREVQRREAKAKPLMDPQQLEDERLKKDALNLTAGRSYDKVPQVVNMAPYPPTGSPFPDLKESNHTIQNQTILFGTPISNVHAVAYCHDESTDHEHAGGVTVASIRWEFVSVPFMFTAFVILAGLTKIMFHHANFLSSIVPESCMLILLGTVVGGIAHVTNNDTLPAFSPDIFFLYLLPPIVLESSYSLHDSSFFSNIGTILLYAGVGTIINVLLIGPSLYFLGQLDWLGGVQLELLECLVFSSLISAVDPVAVLAIFQEVGVNKVLYFLVFGESLLNGKVILRDLRR